MNQTKQKKKPRYQLTPADLDELQADLPPTELRYLQEAVGHAGSCETADDFHDNLTDAIRYAQTMVEELQELQKRVPKA